MKRLGITAATTLLVLVSALPVSAAGHRIHQPMPPRWHAPCNVVHPHGHPINADPRGACLTYRAGVIRG